MTRIIRVRGIGEPTTNNLLSHVTRLLSGVPVVELPWSATYGPVPHLLGTSFSASTGAGQSMLLRELDNGPAVVLGFSGGAAVAGNVAVIGHENLRGTVLLADPLQPDFGSSMFGIAGQREAPNTRWFYRLDDPIPMCPRDSPLRTFSDQSAAFALGDPIAWGADLVDRLNRRRWQQVAIRWWEPTKVWQQYSRAVVDLRNYRLNHPAYGAHLTAAAAAVEAML
ncbi:hypothetical protein [Williamsia sp.]|uniref:alpha/beta fold hydrolase n=1 Tax=Williamsia sp. TaxID=1872085 RepID=UPI002F95CC3C